MENKENGLGIAIITAPWYAETKHDFWEKPHQARSQLFTLASTQETQCRAQGHSNIQGTWDQTSTFVFATNQPPELQTPTRSLTEAPLCSYLLMSLNDTAMNWAETAPLWRTIHSEWITLSLFFAVRFLKCTLLIILFEYDFTLPCTQNLSSLASVTVLEGILSRAFLLIRL